MKFTESCAQRLVTGYNFHHDTVFPHVTSDVHVLMNNGYKHRNAQWTITHGYAYVCGSSPSRRDHLASVLTRPAFSLASSQHTQCFFVFTSHLERHIQVEERVLYFLRLVQFRVVLFCAICLFLTVFVIIHAVESLHSFPCSVKPLSGALV